MAIEVSDSDFQSEVLESKLPVLVDFWAPGCGPCKALSPIVEEIATELVGQVKVVKVNVSDALTTASSYKVSAIPQILIFESGKLESRLTGLHPKQALVDALQPFLKKAA